MPRATRNSRSEQINVDVKTRLKSYPEVGRIVSEAIRHKQDLFREKTSRDLSVAEMLRDLNRSSKAGISPAGLANYKKGHRAVPEAKAGLMAKYLFAGDPKGAGKFLRDLRQAAENEVTTHRSAGDRLAEGQPLRIDVTDYPPFSKTVGTLVDHLCRLSALAKDSPPRRPDFDMRQALWLNEIDLAVGYFANLYRAVHVHFWPTTIKIGLGAVIHKEHEKNKWLIEKVLAGAKIESRSQFCPILVRREVGAIHCLETLQYAENEVELVKDMTAESLRAKAIAEKLKQVHRKSSKIAVAVMDEYTSFDVLTELQGEGIPVLPLSSRLAARESPRRELPASFLSIGCSRKQSELRDVLEQALRLFLITEVESNSLNLASLHAQLLGKVYEVAKKYYPEYKPKGPDPESEREAAAKAFKAAYGWCLYVLGLDFQSIENIPGSGLPWAPILKRTREQVLSRFADEKEKIRDQVSLIVGPDDDPPSEDKFNKLCKSLDLRMQLHGLQREYVLEDRDILVRTIQDGLRGLSPGRPIENGKDGGQITILDPKEPDNQERVRVLDGFIRNLQEFYSKRVGDEAARGDASDSGVLKKIQRFRIDLQENYLKRANGHAADHQAPAGAGKGIASPLFGANADDRFLLASFGKNPTRYLGSACLRPYPRGTHPGWLELFYLWVREDYRQLAVGDEIIKKAERYAQGISKYTHLVVEVLQTLNEAVTYFRKRDFRRGGMTEDGRLILKLEIQRSSESRLKSS
jgi:GNAT superfamily N-acetyltransferase